MPELPEVETIRNSLGPKVIGKVISHITVLSDKNFIGNKSDIIGKKITGLRRYGKVLVFKLIQNRSGKSITTNYLNVHFKLSGQILFADNMKNPVFKNKIPFTKGNIMPANTTRVIIHFQDGSGIFFNDLRKFGWLKITEKPIVPNGTDILSEKFTPDKLFEIITSSSRNIKTVLMDQDKITGIGNIYANDSLFLAGVNPLSPANSLSKKDSENIFNAVVQEIKKGIRDKGSSGADEAFILPDGSRGRHQRRFLVYQREGLPCLKCKTKIKRFKNNGRSSFFCPKCQKMKK